MSVQQQMTTASRRRIFESSIEIRAARNNIGTYLAFIRRSNSWPRVATSPTVAVVIVYGWERRVSDFLTKSDPSMSKKYLGRHTTQHVVRVTTLLNTIRQKASKMLPRNFHVALAVMLSFCVVGTTNAYALHRRQLVQTILGSGSVAVISTIVPESAQAVISSKYCAYGTGDGCDDLAEGNEYIKQLQARSAVNKEAIQQEARNAYYMKNYPDFFASVGKTMIKKADGSFLLVDDGELQKLKDQNKIGLEYAKTMGGRVMDVTQKPILTLKE